MKRLLSIGLSFSLGSFMPILCYILMGLIHGSDELANSLIYTYPYQFVFLLLANVLCVSQLKYGVKDKDGDLNYGKSGIILFLVLSTVISIVSIIRIDVFGVYLGAETMEAQYAFAFGLLSMSIDWTAYYLAEMYYFAEQDKVGLSMLVRWYVCKVIFVLMTVIPWFNYKMAVVFVITCQLFILFVELRRNVPKKFHVSIVYGIKYSLSQIPHDILMTIIHIFSVHSIYERSPIILNTYNILTSCTDTQWDISGAPIDVVVVNNIVDDTFESNKKRIVRQALLYHSFLFISSALMIFICSILFDNIDVKFLVIAFLIEMGFFVFNGVKHVYKSYALVQYPTVLSSLFTTIQHIVRLLVQLFVANKYNVSISVTAGLLLDYVFTFMLYKYCSYKLRRTSK